ncbi:MAG: hypothetical protein ACPG4S_06710, partial [Schleiferiaceae bacterium]
TTIRATGSNIEMSRKLLGLFHLTIGLLLWYFQLKPGRRYKPPVLYLPTLGLAELRCVLGNMISFHPAHPGMTMMVSGSRQ